MTILAGIDEAGYGPTLGPLVVAGVALRVPDHRAGESIWTVLSGSCSGSARRPHGRLPVADSKLVYRQGKGLADLERTTLAWLSVLGDRPTTMGTLLDVVAPGCARELSEYAWYADFNLGLPIAASPTSVSLSVNALKRECGQTGVELLGVFAEPVLEGRFNDVVRRTRNKATLLSGHVFRILARVLDAVSSEPVRVNCDQLGGRRHYREAIQDSWPEYDLQIMQESPERSAYRLKGRDRVVDLEFTTEGERHHFCTALASLYAKYVRELFMHLFNGFWGRQQSGLKPTAGYYTDALRWLADAEPILDRLSIDRGRLVRER